MSNPYDVPPIDHIEEDDGGYFVHLFGPDTIGDGGFGSGLIPPQRVTRDDAARILGTTDLADAAQALKPKLIRGMKAVRRTGSYAEWWSRVIEAASAKP